MGIFPPPIRKKLVPVQTKKGKRKADEDDDEDDDLDADDGGNLRDLGMGAEDETFDLVHPFDKFDQDWFDILNDITKLATTELGHKSKEGFQTWRRDPNLPKRFYAVTSLPLVQNSKSVMRDHASEAVAAFFESKMVKTYRGALLSEQHWGQLRLLMLDLLNPLTRVVMVRSGNMRSRTERDFVFADKFEVPETIQPLEDLDLESVLREYSIHAQFKDSQGDIRKLLKVLGSLRSARSYEDSTKWPGAVVVHG